MSTATARWLAEFEALPSNEKQELARELLRRLPTVDLRDRGIGEAQAADLRARLKTFVEDWDRPEASVYDENPSR